VNKQPRLPGFVIYEDGGYDRKLAKASVGSGWASLIDEVFDKLEELGNPTIIVQVKEKYAGLRIYTGTYDTNRETTVSKFDRFLGELESKSFTICETCGAPGKVRGRGWYYTSCEEHAKPGDEPHKYQPGDPYPEEEEYAEKE
jgi:hypothetical protein